MKEPLNDVKQWCVARLDSCAQEQVFVSVHDEGFSFTFDALNRVPGCIHPIAFNLMKMKTIPIRRFGHARTELNVAEHFGMRDIRQMLGGVDMVQELHRHDHYLLLALAKGSGSHEVDFTSYPVGDHTIYFMRPGHVHELTLKEGCVGHLMQFKADFYTPGDKAAQRALRKAEQTVYFKLQAAQYEELSPILDSIFKEHTARQEGCQDVVRAYLSIVFIALARHTQDQGLTSKVGPYVQERLEELLELIETHVLQIKQVSAYAEMMHLSTYQLNSISKTALDRTCSELINDRIILEAKRYLLATTEQVSGIAYHLGYDDVSYFIRFFKKHTGHTPEAFRQKSR